MNLAVNARDAMQKGGTISIQTANVDLGEDFVRTHPGATPGRYVMFSVTDSGTGMDTKHLGSHLRTLLHHQGNPARAPAWDSPPSTYREAKRRLHYSRQRARCRYHFSHLPAARRRARRSPDSQARAHRACSMLRNHPAGRRRRCRPQPGRGDPQFPRLPCARSGHSAHAIALCCSSTQPIDVLLTDVVMPEPAGRNSPSNYLPLVPLCESCTCPATRETFSLTRDSTQKASLFCRNPSAQLRWKKKIRLVSARMSPHKLSPPPNKSSLNRVISHSSHLLPLSS